jgi:hypothetical protein
MIGVYTAVFVLTFTCYGPFCGAVDGLEQRAELPTQDACTFLRDVVMSRSTAQATVAAFCVGQVRELPSDLVRNMFGAPVRPIP